MSAMKQWRRWGVIAGASVVMLSPQMARAQSADAVSIAPAGMKKIGSVDERFQSYNIEMVEVTGGRFWKPYGATGAADASAPKSAGHNSPNGIDPNLFEYQPPLDLNNPKLRRLAAALAPAYVRVSGTWQNATYFQDDDKAAGKPPAGFNGVVTRAEWKGVIDYAKATGAEVVTSFATSAGTRDAQGVWTTGQAKTFLAATKADGGQIAAAEYMNEPNIPSAAGAPADYDAADYGRDVKVWAAMMRELSPKTLLAGPGSVGEGQALLPTSMKSLKTMDMLQATGPVFDVISYHFYGGVSARCAGPMGAAMGTTEGAALSANWLDRTDVSAAYYAALRDRFEPGKPLWLTETAQTACGGDQWSSKFVDSFRYLNQLGTLAERGVQVVMHNTMAASDYALLDAKTLRPRPNYWAALLWRRTMGTTVLNPGVAKGGVLRVYAHCLRSGSGGVAVLAINTSTADEQELKVPVSYARYTLSAEKLDAGDVMLNGVALHLRDDGNLPEVRGERHAAGVVRLAPESITFLTMPSAKDEACR